jgi:hypothetical protein
MDNAGQILDTHETIYMDYHRQFRLNSQSPAPPLLGKARPGRFPLTSQPSAHAECVGSRVSIRKFEPKREHSAQARPRGTADPEKESAQVRAQVKQLQFWLKVFSRFCQDEPEQD